MPDHPAAKFLHYTETRLAVLDLAIRGNRDLKDIYRDAFIAMIEACRADVAIALQRLDGEAADE